MSQPDPFTDRIDPANIDNPTDFDIGTVNTQYDSANSQRIRLVHLPDSSTWVHYTRSKIGASPTEYAHTICGIGSLIITGITLDADDIADTIRHRAEIDQLDNLYGKADPVAENAVEEYRRAAEEVVGEAVYNGTACIDKKRAWQGHVPEAFQYEAEWALKDTDIDSDHPGRAIDIVRGAISSEAQSHAPRLGPHAEYIVWIDFGDAALPAGEN